MRSHHQELYKTNTLGHHAKTVLQVDHQTHERVQLPILYVNGNKRALITRVRWKVEQTDIGVACHGKFFQNLGLCQQEVISRLSPSAQDLNKHFFLCKVSCPVFHCSNKDCKFASVRSLQLGSAQRRNSIFSTFKSVLGK